MINIRRDFGSVLPVLAATYMTLPESWTKALRLGDVSVMNIIFVLCLVFSFRRRERNGFSGQGWLFWLGGALVYMAGLGLLRRDSEMFDAKVFAADLLTYCGLIAGMMWARRMSVERLARMCRVIAIATVSVLLLDAACLQFHILKPAWEGPRVFVFSMFFGTCWLMVVTPLILATEGTGRGLLSLKWSRFIVTVITAAMLVTVVMSGTRTVALQVLGCGVMCVPLVLRNFRTAYATVIVAMLAGTAAWFLGPTLGDVRFFGNRLMATDLASEERYTEVRMMFDQLNVGTGEGFGVSFVSPVVVEGRNLAVAPHVGVLTLLFKGGFVCFLLAMILPLGKALSSILLTRGRPAVYGCMAGVLLYGFAASLSGGWGFLHLYFFGLMFAAGLKFAHAPVAVVQPERLAEFVELFAKMPLPEARMLPAAAAVEAISER